MAGAQSAWGIEIGAFAIKAIRLERDGKTVRVTDFAVIPHKKVLTTPDVDRDELVRLSLGQFISQKSLEGEHLVMSVPGHAAFARFAKLPPVEPKRVPDIVKFEAVQQIPFPIDQVEWDYQTFMTEDSPEVEVGIFAITRDRVQQRLGLYGELGISPEALTLSPVAVYNAMSYDQNLAERKGPVVFLDIGTNATDVVVAQEGRCWIRTFPLGGTHFTEAIASAFKLSYTKAEKLKREASTSKYAKQIMQAMRPVFSDLLQDLQRSIGYYQTAHSEHELTTMVGLGSTFKIPGLRKFLGQQLQIDMIRLDEYKRIQVTGREAASFAENAVNMATAYGLAIQGVGLAAIDANLVPVKALRDQIWHAKTKWFAAAAAIVVAGSAMMLWRPLSDRQHLQGGVPTVVDTVLQRGKEFKTEFEQERAKSDVGFTVENIRRLLDYRDVWPFLAYDVASALNAADPQEELFGVDREAAQSIPPEERRLVRLERLQGSYLQAAPASPSSGAQPEATGKIAVTLNVQLSHDDPVRFLNSTVAEWLRTNAEPGGERADAPYRILVDSISVNPQALRELRTKDGGDAEVVREGGGAGAAQSPGRGGSSGGGSNSPGRRGGGAGSTTPPGSVGGGPGIGGGGPGRRNPAGSAPGVPGSGLSRGGGPGQTPQAAPPPTSGFPTPAAPGRSGTTGAPPTATLLDLNTAAPMPKQPPRYPANTTYYEVPITFTVEILKQPAAPKPDRSVVAPHSEQGSSA